MKRGIKKEKDRERKAVERHGTQERERENNKKNSNILLQEGVKDETPM